MTVEKKMALHKIYELVASGLDSDESMTADIKLIYTNGAWSLRNGTVYVCNTEIDESWDLSIDQVRNLRDLCDAIIDALVADEVIKDA
jgi:hypothetical protein